MKKLKITESQRQMLESKANAKMTNEMDIRPSQSPSFAVSKEFKKETNGIKGVKTEGVTAQVEWRELVPHVHELIKQMYTKPSKEDMNPFWEENGISWDEIIQLLSSLDLIKSVKGGYRLAKVVASPAKAVKIVAKLIEKMINDKNQPVEEIEQSDIKTSLQKQLAPQPKSGKSKAEILKTIADKRAEELKRREAEKNKPLGEDAIDEYGESGYYPAGAEHDPSAPWNQVDPEPKMRAKTRVMDVLWWDSDFALMKGEGKLWVYSVESADESEYADYAAREETYYGRDEDGDPMVEYGDWEMDGDIIENYVNDNLKHLSRGKGIDDYENGVELVEVDYPLAQDLMGLTKYIAKRNPKGAEYYQKILSSVAMEETTTAASSGSFVGKMATGPIHKSNVADELNEHDPEQAPYLEQLKSLYNDGNVTPEQWISYADDLEPIVKGLQTNENYHSIISAIVGMLQFAEMAQQLGVDNEDAMVTQSGVQMRQGFEDMKRKLAFEINYEKSLPVEEATTTTSVGGDSGTFAYDAPVGDGSDFWNAGNKLNKKVQLMR